MKRLRAWFVAGLLVWVPLGITLLVLNLLVRQLDKTLGLLPPAFRPPYEVFGITFTVPGLGILLTIIVLLVTGLLVANFAGRRLLALGESILHRIPVIRAVYGASKNFAEMVLGDSGDSFKKVLLIEYPRKGVYSLAFQTSSALGEVQGRTGEDVVCTFVPTTPNPTSGFIIMVPRKDIIELDMEVDEALKMIISLGVVVPEWQGGEGRTPLAAPEARP
ncbi:MAG: DUF502 domain-containing protein [Gammaproteobacteria bacterium]